MNIIQLCPYAMDRPGGVQLHVRDLTNWLIGQGHNLCVISPPSPKQKPIHSPPYIEIGHSKQIGIHGTAFEISFAPFWQMRSLKKHMAEFRPDLIHVHTPWTPMIAGQVISALKLPLVTTIHATLPDHTKTGVLERYIRHSARRFLQKSQAVVTPSATPIPLLKTLLSEIEPSIIPPAIDLSSWRDQGFAKKRNSFLFLGRLEDRKGVDVLLLAWPIIKTALPNAELIIAGDGPMRDHVSNAQLPGMSFVGDIPRQRIMRLMAETEVFLAPAKYGESFGLVLAEAMAASTVPIAASNPGYASVLTEMPELLVPPNDPKALAVKAIQLSNHDNALQELQNRVQNLSYKADIERAGRTYAELYESVLHNSA